MCFIAKRLAERENTSVKENMSQMMVIKKARLHKICPLTVQAAEPSRGGWMDPGLPHGRGRSYCSVERGRESATPSTDPHAHPPPAPPAPAGGPRHRQRVWVVWTQLVDRPWALTNKRFFRWWPDGGTIHYAILWLGYPASATGFSCSHFILIPL